MPRSVSGSEFRDALDRLPLSPALLEQLQRFQSFDDWIAHDAAVHIGNLDATGTFQAPALCTLVSGNVRAEVVDLCSGFDASGLLIVAGDVHCRHFLSHYGVQCFIDGDLTAEVAIISGFGDASLTVVGSLNTRLHVAGDIWTEVGGGAVMEYGNGYCVPLFEGGRVGREIRPLHSEEDTARRLATSGDPATAGSFGDPLDPERLARLVRSGQPLFRA